MKVDFHVHSSISDGSDTISDIFEKVKKNKVKHFSITDHDIVVGNLDAFLLSDDYSYYTGIEISAKNYQNGRKVHLLGYRFNPEQNILKEYSEYMTDQRNESIKTSISKLQDLGYKIEFKDFLDRSKSGHAIYKQHIMAYLVDMGYTDKIYGSLNMKFREQGIFQDLKYLDYMDGFKLLKDIGALVVLAHPGVYDSWNLIPELVEKGLDGLEVYHSKHDINNVARAISIKGKYRLLGTGGSDYHGSYDSIDNDIGLEIPDDIAIEFLKAVK